MMHPTIIHYHQIHPDGAFIGKMCEKDIDCDLLIVIGTSLYVDGVKRLVKTFCRAPNVQGKRILVNLTKPNKEWNDFFDYFYEGDCNKFVKMAKEMKNTPKTVEKKSLSKNQSFYESNFKVKTKPIDNSKIINASKNEIKQRISSFEIPFSNTLANRKSKNLIKNDKEYIHRQEFKENSDEIYIRELDEVINKSLPIEPNDKDYFNNLSDTDIDVQVRKLSIDNKQHNFESKLKILTRSLSDEETINMNVLEEVIKTSTQTEIDLSNCSSLQSEIESIVKESFTRDDF